MKAVQHALFAAAVHDMWCWCLAIYLVQSHGLAPHCLCAGCGGVLRMMDSALYLCGRLPSGACVTGVPCRRRTPNVRTPCPQLPHLPRRCLKQAPCIDRIRIRWGTITLQLTVGCTCPDDA